MGSERSSFDEISTEMRRLASALTARLAGVETVGHESTEDAGVVESLSATNRTTPATRATLPRGDPRTIHSPQFDWSPLVCRCSPHSTEPMPLNGAATGASALVHYRLKLPRTPLSASCGRHRRDTIPLLRRNHCLLLATLRARRTEHPIWKFLTGARQKALAN